MIELRVVCSHIPPEGVFVAHQLPYVVCLLNILLPLHTTGLHYQLHSAGYGVAVLLNGAGIPQQYPTSCRMSCGQTNCDWSALQCGLSLC
jgi:hypothetical protein